MNKIRLFIADADADSIAGVRRALYKSPSIEVIGAATNGALALDSLSAYRPDVLLTDINLPELDGIELLRRCRRMRVPPVCIVCTRFYSDLCVAYASRNGAAFFLYKPIDYERLPGIICDCWRDAGKARCDDETTSEDDASPGSAARSIHALMREMGIPSNLSGRQYIAEAVLCLYSDRRLLKNMSNGLYEQVARKTNARPASIERAIRGAISAAYERGSLSRHFSRRPTNRAFLEYILSALIRNDRAQTAEHGIGIAGYAQKTPGGVL